MTSRVAGLPTFCFRTSFKYTIFSVHDCMGYMALNQFTELHQIMPSECKAGPWVE